MEAFFYPQLEVVTGKDKLEDMDVSLKFALIPSGAIFFTWSLWQIIWTKEY